MRYFAIAVVVLTLTLELSAGDAPLYEGRAAEDWAIELGKLDFNQIKQGMSASDAERREKFAAYFEYEHIQHALVMLGAESLRPLADLLRKTSNRSGQVVITGIIYGLKPAPKDDFAATLFELLKDEHHGVRRVAIAVLCTEIFMNDPRTDTAIKAMLKDSDLAVVEAAEGGLATIKQLREPKAAQPADPF